MGATSQKSRRSALNYILGGGLAALVTSVLYPVMKFLVPPARGEAQPAAVLAGKVDELRPNSGKIFHFGNRPGILLRTPDGELRAFSAVCTHLGCTVEYREDLQHIWCACHNGHYDLNGVNIAGPPPRPLPPYKVIIKGDEVFASKET